MGSFNSDLVEQSQSLNAPELPEVSTFQCVSSHIYTLALSSESDSVEIESHAWPQRLLCRAGRTILALSRKCERY